MFWRKLPYSWNSPLFLHPHVFPFSHLLLWVIFSQESLPGLQNHTGPGADFHMVSKLILPPKLRQVVALRAAAQRHPASYFRCSVSRLTLGAPAQDRHCHQRAGSRPLHVASRVKGEHWKITMFFLPRLEFCSCFLCLYETRVQKITSGAKGSCNLWARNVGE